MQKEILLISTDMSGLTYMRLLLARAGYSVYLLREPHLAVETIAEQRPSLIIIDDQTNLSAVQLCHELKSKPTITAIKIIVLLPYANCSAIETARATKGTDVLTKPVLPHLLVEMVTNLIRKERIEPV